MRKNDYFSLFLIGHLPFIIFHLVREFVDYWLSIARRGQRLIHLSTAIRSQDGK